MTPILRNNFNDNKLIDYFDGLDLIVKDVSFGTTI